MIIQWQWEVSVLSIQFDSTTAAAVASIVIGRSVLVVVVVLNACLHAHYERVKVVKWLMIKPCLPKIDRSVLMEVGIDSQLHFETIESKQSSTTAAAVEE